MRELFRLEVAPPQIDRKRSIDLGQRPEIPITDDTFSEFNSLVMSIIKPLGIGNSSKYCAYSEGIGSEPGIIISHHEDSDEDPDTVHKTYVFDVRVELKDRATKILIPDDAGTVLNPLQIEANQTTFDLNREVICPKRVLTDPMLGGLTHLIEQRLSERPFRRNDFRDFP
jgi:hypothetical protein